MRARKINLMRWQPTPRFGGFWIWVAEVRGHWVASVAALPEGGATAHVNPGADVVPGQFATEEDARDAAMDYIVRKHQPEGKATKTPRQT